MVWLWRRRKTNWPSHKVREAIVTQGCMLVVKSHPFSINPDIEYRLSFAVAEKHLLISLSNKQRQCFIIFKTIIKFCLGPDSPISSYCLKTTFLWALEEMPLEEWEDSLTGCGRGFMFLLDKLIEFIKNYNIPQYFIPENNLIVHVDHKNLHSARKALLRLRKCPFGVFSKFSKIYRLNGHYNVFELMSNGYARRLKMVKSLNDFHVVRKDWFECISQNGYEKFYVECAIETRKMHKILHPDTATKAIEYFDKHFYLMHTRQENIKSYQLHGMFYKKCFFELCISIMDVMCKNVHIEDEVQTKIKKLYIVASTYPELMMSSLYYGLFLVKTEEAQGAIDILERVLQRHSGPF